VLFKELSWPGFFSMAIFVATLLLGLAYVWKKGALDWEG
jgi:NADH-quinone oxidoreductase subunit A